MDGILNSIVDSSLVSEKYRERMTKEELIEIALFGICNPEMKRTLFILKTLPCSA